ncbi:MAG: glycosyltransferase 87 family protein [Candidatus Odinarchaeota archaeon]
MNKTKILFLFAVLLNAVYIGITFIFFFYLNSPLMSSKNSDYLTFYNAGLIIIDDPSNLCNSLLYLFPFRYLPISAYFFTPFSLLGLKLGFFFYQIFNFALNLVIIYLIFKIIQVFTDGEMKMNINYKLNRFKDLFDEPDNESILHHSAIFLLMLPQFLNYFLGQINILVSFFILSSLFYFLKDTPKYDLLGGFFLGLGISFKPSLILLLPFLFLLNFNRETRKWRFQFKRTLLRLFGTILLIILTGLYFIIYPDMIKGFIEVNLTGDYIYNIGGNLEINPSFSLTRIVLILFQLIRFDVNSFAVFIIITLLFYVPIFILYIYSEFSQKKLIYGYFAGISIMLLIYFDSWPHHVVTLAPFLIFFILLEKDFKSYKFLKTVYYLIAFLMLVFWIIFYLTYKILPLNLGGLLLIIFVYYILALYYTDQVKLNSRTLI